MQFEQLKHGEAALFGLEYRGKNIVYAYFQFADGKCIYSSGADDPDYAGLPLYHILIYSAMVYFKQRKIHFIDTGQPSCPWAQHDYYPDPKQLNIALFKRGFAGRFVPNFRGKKYLTQEAFLADQTEFADKYARVIELTSGNKT